MIILLFRNIPLVERKQSKPEYYQKYSGIKNNFCYWWSRYSLDKHSAYSTTAFSHDLF